MKIRSISLTNVRRFAGQTATISGIGDGISVVAQPNEFGKSTFFDALHAVFFTPYGSRNKDILSLQPHPAGGKVEISVDLDLPMGRFRIDKRFLSKPMARVTNLDRAALIAQDDEAEAWIKALTDQGLTGPAGLLWVRQGVTTLDAGNQKANAEALTERRNLLSTVAGEIDMMTGGRRMDRVRERCVQELGRYASATGKPRTGGPWKETRDEIDRLGDTVTTLTHSCRELSDALARRREIEARLTLLENPATRESQGTALESAKARVALADAHAAKLTDARQTVQIATLTRQDVAQRLDALTHAINLTGTLRQTAATARATEADIAERLVRATTTEATAKAGLTVAENHLRALRDRLADVRRQIGAREARDRVTVIATRLAEAEGQRATAEQAQARVAANPATPDRIAALDKAAAAAGQARVAANAQAVTITLHYDSTARVLCDGMALGDGITALDGPTTLTLPGIGQMTVDPGAGKAADNAALVRATNAFAGALAACGADSIEAAHHALRDRQEAEHAARLAQAMLKSLAPEGLAALRALLTRTIAAAGEGAAPSGDAPARGTLSGAHADAPSETPPETLPDDPAILEFSLPACEAAEAEARLKHDASGRSVAALAAERTGARFILSAALTALSDAEAAAGDPATRALRQAVAQTGLALAEAELDRANTAQTALLTNAPDADTARAELARAQGTVTQTQREIDQLRIDRARLEGEIGKQADLGVEESLAEAEEALAAATDRDARYGAEVAALTRLLAILEDTRTAAREAYFGPVQRELQPLLSILAQDAALTFDPDSLLPGTLSRHGGDEPLATLSGGTQEQIAILTRLAFARLFAKAGRPVPVILDDALVHTDDDRIVRMFTALHRVATDQQVIVFTCRQMAFQELGGERPGVRIVATA